MRSNDSPTTCADNRHLCDGCEDIACYQHGCGYVVPHPAAPTRHRDRIITPLPTKHELILELVEGLERDLDEALKLLKYVASSMHCYPTEVDDLLAKYGRTPE